MLSTAQDGNTSTLVLTEITSFRSPVWEEWSRYFLSHQKPFATAMENDNYLKAMYFVSDLARFPQIASHPTMLSILLKFTYFEESWWCQWKQPTIWVCTDLVGLSDCVTATIQHCQSQQKMLPKKLCGLLRTGVGSAQGGASFWLRLFQVSFHKDFPGSPKPSVRLN